MVRTSRSAFRSWPPAKGQRADPRQRGTAPVLSDRRERMLRLPAPAVGPMRRSGAGNRLLPALVPSVVAAGRAHSRGALDRRTSRPDRAESVQRGDRLRSAGDCGPSAPARGRRPRRPAGRSPQGRRQRDRPQPPLDHNPPGQHRRIRPVARCARGTVDAPAGSSIAERTAANARTARPLGDGPLIRSDHSVSDHSAVQDTVVPLGEPPAWKPNWVDCPADSLPL